MKEKLEQIKTKGLEKIENVKTISELEEVRKELTGKKSELSEVLKSMKDLSPEEKKTTGMLATEIKKSFENTFLYSGNLRLHQSMNCPTINPITPTTT